MDFENHVLRQLDDLRRQIEDLKSIVIKDMIKNREEIAALKVKAGYWGLIGGSISVTIGLVLAFFKAKLIKGD